MTQRTKRLNDLYHKVLHGQAGPDSRSLNLFLEAICVQESPAAALSKVVASPSALDAFARALLSDTSLAFLTGRFTQLLQYIQAPELQAVCGGAVLQQLLCLITDTPILWDTFVQAASDQSLDEKSLGAFAWLLVQLLSLPTELALSHVAVAQKPAVQRSLLNSPSFELQARGRRIVEIAQTLVANPLSSSSAGTSADPIPGGRHDNDFAEIHRISIYPTSEELRTADVYLPTVDMVEKQSLRPEGLAVHVDAQFRLLREDMLRDLREEIMPSSQGNRRRKPFAIHGLTLAGVYCDGRNPFAIKLEYPGVLPQLRAKDDNERQKILQADKRFLKHGTLISLSITNEFLTLGTLMRDESLLSQQPTTLCIQIPIRDLENALLRLKSGGRGISVLQVDTALYAYEPVLRQLKETRELSLKAQIVSWQPGDSIPVPDYTLQPVFREMLDALLIEHDLDLQSYLDLPNTTKLDKAQAGCFRAALMHKLAEIQGPPGTGKSFIGALAGKAIYRFSSQTILVVCYTHHALDDFLEALIKLGITPADVVRLGSAHKATAFTKPLSLNEQRSSHRFTREQREMIDKRKADAARAGSEMVRTFQTLVDFKVPKQEILDYLEFVEDDKPFFSAFEIPRGKDGMTAVGRGGKAINKFYLLDRWMSNQNAGIFVQQMSSYAAVWSLPSEVRRRYRQQWEQTILQERVVSIRELGRRYNDALVRSESVFLEKDLAVMRKKRIIACTTTAAAKYSDALRSIAPGVVLVEEAGEILESHVLTALSPTTKQLILIGDHKQLRPKVNYELSVEKGTGYDLNRSLFERLILKGFPHKVLFSQHRMRPEISALIRELTYPDLTDADKTQGRPNLRGFTDNLMLVNHSEMESELPQGRELGDTTATSSKQNLFEAKMTLRCVRYLGQQGYRTDEMVVLTPYLGQLRLLLDELSKENDPVLNDLDSFDLVRAGLMPAATARVSRSKLRLSTIDNYQGEEADIVIISLTRSNANGDVGFMYSPERVNVLLSRARNAMIMIGNAEHFMGSRKGGELWTRLVNMLKAKNHIYDGFPVRCERHPLRTALLSQPSAFDAQCPDGGCDEPCQKMLRCGLHKCPHRCHNIEDHSKMDCHVPIQSKCPQGHVTRKQCFRPPGKSCKKCDAEAEKIRKAAERKFKEQEEQQAHLLRMDELEREIQAIREQADDQEAARQRTAAYEQKKNDLRVTKSRAKTEAAEKADSKPESVNGTSTAKDSAPVSGSPQQPKTTEKSSEPEKLWERQKQFQGASNDAIDALMGLTGLEAVKTKILAIKAKIETYALQGTDLSKERFGMTMLGNPGTGKTTVARLYGKFLSSVKAIPGDEFVETTGSSLANDGVPGLKKKIEDLNKAGGGVFFLDEAYQLASGNSFGGKAVLDYLLAEIEEQRGKIAFVLAGYHKEMEKFFQHNPGFPSRVPNELVFGDYSDEELLVMLGSMIYKKYKGRAKLEGGPDGLYTRIIVRRQGRRRGTEGYGNARDLENVWSKVAERQAARLARERDQGRSTDSLFFSFADVIGPEPSKAIKDSKAWKKLQTLIGLRSVKNSINAVVERIQLNYKRELEEKPPIEVSLNRLFLGSPGTGKTTVAKLYGTILAEIGLLSKGEMVVKTPADFVGGALGQSEANTKAILKATEGKVLVIDEAYGLSPSTGSIGNGTGGDPYKMAVIDTIVAAVQSVPGEDRCVLLLGYESEMRRMLKDANPGLNRRFPLESAFHFEDFDDADLRSILNLKLKDQALDATDEAKDVAINILARARDKPNFGNAGEVENLLSRAKDSWQNRFEATEQNCDVVFIPKDFDAKHDRAKSSHASVHELFADIVGLEGLREKLENWQKMTVQLKARDQDPRKYIPFNFVFKGPPGTGKTTVARRIASFYYQIGILPTEEFSECSAADLIAPYVGQSAPKTREALRSALGKVLFIDEAYRLQDGEFGKEAVNEIVDCLTKPDFIGKLVVILAGYTNDMNSLLRVNQGLASRFPEEVFFESMAPDRCISLLSQLLSKEGIKLPAALDDTNSLGNQQLAHIFSELGQLNSFGNGRDVTTLSKKIAGKAIVDADPASPSISVTIDDMKQALSTMLSEQSARAEVNSKPLSPLEKQFMKATAPLQTISPLPSTTTATTSTSDVTVAEPEPEQGPAPEPVRDLGVDKILEPQAVRDYGVSDQVWEQLQLDKAAEEERASNAEAEIEREHEAFSEAEREEQLIAQAVVKLQALARAKKEADDAKARAEEEELRRRIERERIRQAALKRQRDEAQARWAAAQEAEARRRQQEAQAQKKLRDLGVCPVGFQWIKQAHGYRCAGGSHFVDNAALGI